jgi:RHS repeat-associated protein
MDEWYARDDADGRSYFLTDLVGSTVALTDASGALTTRYDYSPYGEATTQTLAGTPSGNPFQYTGRENDGTGLYYYRARYYSPEFKRFTQEDPLGFVDGPNAYAYVGGSPLTNSDPTGQFINSVQMACMQDMVMCDELGDELINARAKLARRLGDECGAQFWDAVGGLKSASAPLLWVIRIASVAKSSGLFHKHHTVPREILKKHLPADVARNPAVRGRAGAPNRWRIPKELHENIHAGPGGGAYNEEFIRRLQNLNRAPTVDDVVRIRDSLVRQFGLESYRP